MAHYFLLNTGAKIPSVGLGTWQAEPGVVGDAIAAATKIGSTLKKLFDDGVVKREDLFITSKLWCTDHEPEDVPVAIDATLQDLRLDYLDLYLIHFPLKLEKGARLRPENVLQPDIPRTWAAMEKLYHSGKARAIGVSNFSSKKLEELLSAANIPPAVNQVECHPIWQQKKLRSLCEANGIHLSAFSPLGSPGTTWIDNKVLVNSTLREVAGVLGKTPAQIALRWGVQMGHSVMPKSTNEGRIKENIDIFGWSIPDELFAIFSDIEQERLIRAHFCVGPQSFYRTAEELWDGEL